MRPEAINTIDERDESEDQSIDDTIGQLNTDRGPPLFEDA